MQTTAAVHKSSSKKHPYEDRFRLLDGRVPPVEKSGRGYLYAVMDGIGGAPNGMQAAQLLADRLLEFYTDPTIEASAKGLDQLTKSISAEAHGRGFMPGTDRPLAACAATVVWFAPDKRLYVLHVGDTLAVRFDGDRLTQLTREHGTGKVIHRYLGQGKGFYMDIDSFDIEEGETICLVTDGVTKSMQLHDIKAVLEELPDSQRAATEMVVRARNRRSADDITCLVIELDEW